MQTLLRKLTYANVVATLALFLALGGGAVWAAGQLGKNVVKSKNIAANAIRTQDIAKNAVKTAKIAANAVRGKNLAKNSVSAGKVKKGTLTRTQLKAGTLAGLQVAEVQATNVPALATDPPDPQGTAIPLTGTATFTPQPGKSYELLGELRGNPSDADGGGPKECFAFVRIYVNGEPTTGVGISADATAPPPFTVNSVGTTGTGIALLTPGQPQTIAANALGSTGCGSGTTGNLRIVVVEFG
ncbi:MAG TPA: hypothetical protein VHQ43_07740 [Solirubrobacterales bacterium]|jgi:hypothetical protein|nr:hypothetical protein [Solirubrobacterales bacterium]